VLARLQLADAVSGSKAGSKADSEHDKKRDLNDSSPLLVSGKTNGVSVPAQGWAHSSIDFRLASAMFDFRRLGIPNCFCSHPSIIEWA
jgi:hypothetical protein